MLSLIDRNPLSGINERSAQLKLGISLLALAVAWSAPASAQQFIPGVSGNCPIVAGVANCTGDISGGITTGSGDPGFGTLNFNPAAPIAPNGYFAIGVQQGDQDIAINIAISPADSLQFIITMEALTGG